MKNTLQLLSLVILFVFCTQCTKKSDTEDLKELSANHHPIVGQWDWDYSQYPFSPDSVIASPDSIQRTLHFRINDTVYEETYYKGVLVPSASKSMHYRIIMHFDGMDSVPAIELDGIRWGFGIYSNTLSIDMSRNDYGTHWYTRK